MNEPLSSIVLYDGECGLCTGSVQFIIRHEKHPVFRFASFQSVTGKLLCHRHGIDRESLKSLVLIYGNDLLQRSDAALAIASELAGLWRGLTILRLVPRAWRDWCYDIIARNRYAWFGRHAGCLVSTPDIGHRFMP